MKLEREAVDALAREILGLLERLRPVLEGSTTSWPAGRGRLAAVISLDLIRAVQALDVAVEELYFQAGSQGLRFGRRSPRRWCGMRTARSTGYGGRRARSARR